MSQYAPYGGTQDATIPYVIRLLLFGNTIVIAALYPNDMVGTILHRSIC